MIIAELKTHLEKLRLLLEKVKSLNPIYREKVGELEYILNAIQNGKLFNADTQDMLKKVMRFHKQFEKNEFDGKLCNLIAACICNY